MYALQYSEPVLNYIGMTSIKNTDSNRALCFVYSLISLHIKGGYCEMLYHESGVYF